MMSLRYALPFFAFSLCNCGTQQVTSRELTSHEIKVGSLSRTYSLHVPTQLTATDKAPLVMVFHGSGDDGAGIAEMTSFSPLADNEGFIVAYPDALDENWNDGREAPDIDSQVHHVDDIAFVEAMIADIRKSHSIDSKRIYATGFSNGGIFADYLGGHLSDRLAAIAPVSGGLAEPYMPHFKPSSPISVLIIHGDQDKLVPFDGGNVDYERNGRIIPTLDTLKHWRDLSGCESTPATGMLPDANTRDHCTVKWERWSGGRAGTEVMMFTVLGGGHGWPGGPQFLPPNLIGWVCQDFDAAPTIWDFFKKHPKG